MSLPNKVQKMKQLEMDFGTTVCQALWLKAVQLANYIEQSYPVGKVLLMHETQPNLPSVPNSKYWQALDGSVVSNANSLMNGVTLPDFRDKFFRHVGTGEVLYVPTGSNTVNLAHNHGGNTQSVNPRGAFTADAGSDAASQGPHTHSVSSDLGSVTNIPQYIALKAYIRIV